MPDLLGDAGAEKIERNVRGAVHEQNLRHGVLKKTPGIIERGDNARWFEEFGDIACAGGGVWTDGDELDFTGGAERYNSGKPVMPGTCRGREWRGGGAWATTKPRDK